MQYKRIEWKDVSVVQWQELQDIINDKTITPTGFVLEVGDMFYDFDDDVSEKELNKIKKGIEFIATPCIAKTKPEINGKPLPKFTRMSIAKFIDLDVSLVKNEWVDAVPLCAQILYDLDDVESLKITDIIGAVLDFVKYRKEVYEKYPNIFVVEDDEDYEPDEDETPEDPATVWLKTLFGMSEGRLSEYAFIKTQPHILVFNWVSVGDSLKSRRPRMTE